jgi:hypothetical protein
MRKLLLLALIFILFMFVACASNIATPAPINNADAIEATVTGTRSVIPSATALPSPAITVAPEAPAVLPQNLYYQGVDSNAERQVFRLGKDGSTITQITNEPDEVNYFDVSLSDGRITYRSDQKLLLVDPDGENRRVLVESQISSGPLWSPDGETIVYGTNDGLYFYSMETGVSTLILGNDEDSQSYAPRAFSPDGSKLLVSIARHGFISGGYDLVTEKVTPVPLNTLNRISWLADSKQIFIYASFAGGISYGVSLPGLWRYNVENGAGNSLFPDSSSGDICIQAPTQDVTGFLIYLYGTEHPCTNPALSLVRSSPDAMADRVQLRPEAFDVIDTLWTPDLSALLILQKDSSSNTVHSLKNIAKSRIS